MNRDELEFQISHYLDGTLSTEETAALETLLASNVEAQKLLGEYRQVNSAIVAALPIPSINWDRFADQISATIFEAAEKQVIAGRISPKMWVLRSRMAIAASVIMLLTTGIVSTYIIRSTSSPTGQATKLKTSVAVVNQKQPVEMSNAPASIFVTGPQAEVAKGPMIQDIKVGPSPALAAQEEYWRYAEGVITRPSSVSLAGSPPATRPVH